MKASFVPHCPAIWLKTKVGIWVGTILLVLLSGAVAINFSHLLVHKNNSSALHIKPKYVSVAFYIPNGRFEALEQDKIVLHSGRAIVGTLRVTGSYNGERESYTVYSKAQPNISVQVSGEMVDMLTENHSTNAPISVGIPGFLATPYISEIMLSNTFRYNKNAEGWYVGTVGRNQVIESMSKLGLFFGDPIMESTFKSGSIVIRWAAKNKMVTNLVWELTAENPFNGGVASVSYSITNVYGGSQ